MGDTTVTCHYTVGPAAGMAGFTYSSNSAMVASYISPYTNMYQELSFPDTAFVARNDAPPFFSTMPALEDGVSYIISDDGGTVTVVTVTSADPAWCPRASANAMSQFGPEWLSSVSAACFGLQNGNAYDETQFGIAACADPANAPRLNPLVCTGSDAAQCAFLMPKPTGLNIPINYQLSTTAQMTVSNDPANPSSCPDVTTASVASSTLGWLTLLLQVGCIQTQWPWNTASAAMTACCAQTGWASVTASATAYCKPSWNPFDPQGDCEPVMAAACRAASVTRTDTDGSVTTVHGFLGPSDTACGQWYRDALNGATWVPHTRWPVIDAEIYAYCATPDADPTACACVNFGAPGTSGLCSLAPATSATTATGSGATPAGCFMYASVSQPGTASGGMPGVSVVGLQNASDGFPLGLSDYACVEPSCAFPTGATVTSLLPYDVVFARSSRGTCPADICFSVVEGLTVSVGTVEAGQGIYIGDAVDQCDGAAGTTSGDAPAVVSPATQTSLLYVNPYSGDCPIGQCGAEATWTFVSANPNPLNWTVTTGSGWPDWIDFADPEATSGTTAVNTPVQALFTISDVTRVPLGTHDLPVTVSDQVFARVRASGTLRVMAVSAQGPRPPVPPAPNPGQGIPVIPAPRSAMAGWVPYGIAAAACLALVFLAALVVALKARGALTKHAKAVRQAMAGGAQVAR